MQVKLTWEDNVNGEAEFEIWRTSDPPIAAILIGTSPAGSSSFIDSTPLIGLNFYHVRGKNGANFTNWSVWASINVPVISGSIGNLVASLIG